MSGRRGVCEHHIDDYCHDEGNDKRASNDRNDLSVVGARRLRAHRPARVGRLAVRGSTVADLGRLLGVAALLVSALRVASLLGVSACALLRLERLLIVLRKWRTHSELS